MKRKPIITLIVLSVVLLGASGAASPPWQTSHAAPDATIRDAVSGGLTSRSGDETVVQQGSFKPTSGISYGSCQEIHDAISDAADGEYVIRHGGNVFQVYCAGMDGGAPLEYLTLDPANNYAQYTAEGHSPGTDVRTVYSRVRLLLQPDALRIDISDQTYASSTGGLNHGGPGGPEVKSVPYGVAMDCRGVFSQEGVARIDLRGTPFMVNGTFMKCGFEPAGSWVFSAGNQVVDLTGGGDCGSVQPDAPLCLAEPFNGAGGPQPILELSYLHGSCQEIHDAMPDAADGEYVIRHEGNAFQVYCADMAGGAPLEYLTLDPANNYAQYTARGQSPGTDVRTEYSRVRLRLQPGALQVDISDQRYASSTGSLDHGGSGNWVESVPFGVAMDCRGGFSQEGVARIDLRGTPFMVNDTFVKCGWLPAGTWTFSAGNQVVVLTGGGDCGFVQPGAPYCLAEPFNGAWGPHPILELGYSPAGEEGLTVPWVKEQFYSLQLHGDPMAFKLGVGDEPSMCRHYQGMARVNGPDGTPYIILTRSGKDTEMTTCTPSGNYPGELLVVRMGSRGKDGERLRSNLMGLAFAMKDTCVPKEDEGVQHIHFNGLDGWPPYSHPGGVQLVDDVLVVPLEGKCENTYLDDGLGQCRWYSLADKRALALIDVRNPESPSLIRSIDLGDGPNFGVVGATYVRPDEHPIHGGRYLFVMTWQEDTNTLNFAWSDTDDLRTTTSLEVETFTWSEDALGGYKDKWGKWQMLNVVRDTYDELGPLFLIGAEKAVESSANDWVGLFQVDVSKLRPESYQQAISYVAQKHLYLKAPDMGSLDAASGVYVSPTGQLILYTGPHDNNRCRCGECGVEMGEFRNIDVSQGDTKARQTMCPWIELYEDDPGWDDDSPDRSLMLDFQDRKLDSWDDLSQEDFNDEADSLRWYLKPGQEAILCLDTHFGDCKVPLIAHGRVGWGSLDNWRVNDKTYHFGDKTGSVKMGPFADPGGPYTGYKGRPIPLDAANLCYTDPSDTQVIFSWGVDSPACTLSDASARQPSLICDASGSYMVTLTVTDWVPADQNYSASNSTTVTVEDVQRVHLPVVLRNLP